MATVAAIILHKVMYNDENALKALWRLSGGNRDKAFDIIRKSTAHWTTEQVQDIDIDVALGHLNGGCEVEWAS